ncbi:MAG: hypothetical protein ACK5DE_04815 [Bacteroidota bacterium]|jgi:hypothetical protein
MATLGDLLGLFGSIYSSNQAANAAQQAGQQAAQASQFRPVGVTTRFGRSGFNYGPNGELIGAGYQAAPDVAAMRESLLGIGGGALQQAQQAQGFFPQVQTGAQGLFNLGSQYVAQTPQAAAADYMSKQQALLAPQREQQLAGVRNRLFQTGRSGLATGATSAGNMAATNPEMAAYYNALAQQDAQLAANAQQAGQQQVQFGQGLMSGALGLQGAGYNLQNQALAPFTGAFQAATGVENQAMNPLNIGAGLGSSATAAARQAALLQLEGQQQANKINADSTASALYKLQDPVAALINKLVGGP